MALAKKKKKKGKEGYQPTQGRHLKREETSQHHKVATERIEREAEILDATIEANARRILVQQQHSRDGQKGFFDLERQRVKKKKKEQTRKCLLANTSI